MEKTEKIAHIQNKHIARLQANNRELAEALAEERKLRKQILTNYRKRKISILWQLVDLFSFIIDLKR